MKPLPSARAQGIGSLEEVAAVVLEADGSFSVLRRAGEAEGEGSTLANVAGRGASPPSDRPDRGSDRGAAARG